jgi:hypothetical protein
MGGKYILVLIVLAGMFTVAAAQGGSKKAVLQSISSIGILNGSRGSSLALQSIIGLGYRQSFLGVGAGLDYYRFRSIPVFVDLRHEFGKGERELFLYGDLGYNYDWVVKNPADPWSTYSLQDRFGGGLYYDVGAGCTFRFSRSEAFIISGGYSLKKLSSETGSGVCPLIGPCYDGVQTLRYQFSRFVLKAGLKF